MTIHYALLFQRANFYVGNQFFETIISDSIQVKTVLPYGRKMAKGLADSMGLELGTGGDKVLVHK